MFKRLFAFSIYNVCIVNVKDENALTNMAPCRDRFPERHCGSDVTSTALANQRPPVFPVP